VSVTRLARVVALVLSLAACAATPPVPAAQEAVVGGMPLTPEHTLTAGDEFEIRFPFSPELNDRVAVGLDGNVAPKMLGSLLVGGLTVPEATARLRTLYAARLKSPELSITMRAYAPEAIYVEGEVARPGLIHSEMPLTVSRAIAQAGGAKMGARTGEVLVIRRDAEGRVRAYQAELGQAELGHPPAGGSGAVEPFLKSFDIVYVPQNPITSVADFLALYGKNLPFEASYQTPAPTRIIPPTLTPH